jgi:branched-chain amino acid transport system substrate-binding protein
MADDDGLAETAVQVARRYRDNTAVLAVIGHTLNATSLAAAPIYGSSANPVPVISPTASFHDPGRAGPNVFRVWPDAAAHVVALAEWARSELGIRGTAILYHNDPDSRTSAAEFRRVFAERGGTLLAEDPFSQALPSFEPYLTRAGTRGRVEALLVIGGGTSIGPILATLDSVGLNSAIMGNVDLLQYAQAEGNDLEGAFLSAAYLSDRGGASNESFVTAYRQAHGGQYPDHTAAGAYDIVYLIANAVDGAGPARAGIIAYLSGLGTETEPFEGATGTIAFDEDGNLQRTSVEIGVVSDGVVVSARER